MSASANMEYFLAELRRDLPFNRMLGLLTPGFEVTIKQVKELEAEVAELRDGNEFLLVQELRREVYVLTDKLCEIRGLIRPIIQNAPCILREAEIKT